LRSGCGIDLVADFGIYLQKLRIASAKRLLEGGHRSMREISDALGYQDLAFFREVFQRHTAVSPSTYRQRFGQ
jgi:YesN/AraC family two-component response regulator